MASSPSLLIVLLGEVILLLLVILVFVVIYLRKQKALLKKLIEKSNEVKAVYEEKTREYEGFYAEMQAYSKAPNLPDYFAMNISDAQQRYEKYTQATIPKIDVAQAFNAKVAALRYLYLTAEKEVFNERGMTQVGWTMFEKKLADIVRWFTKQTTHRQDVRSNRTRILQERIDELKPFEVEAKKLQRSLEHSKQRQAQLEAAQKESKATILSLQKTLRSMSPAGSAGANSDQDISVSSMSTEEYLAYGTNQMDSISTMSDKKGDTLKSIIFELNNHHADMSPEIRQKVDGSIKMMEIEMMKSEKYISNLKKELQEAKEQATNYALMLRENNGVSRKSANEQEGDALLLSASNKDYGLTEISSLSSVDYLDHGKVMQEIKQLRENNQSQRSIIVNLEGEISLLKDSILTTEDDGVRAEKQKEVDRLARLVKECEGCIEILESEVDNLYVRLQERGAPQEAVTNDVQENDDIDVVKLGMEVEAMATEMEKIAFQYRQTHSINQFIYDILKCTSVNDVAKNIVQFIKEFNAPAGFCIASNAGSAKYFPSQLFNDSTKELVKSFSFKDPVFHLSEGILFSSKKICLLLLPAVDQAKILSETTLQGLIRVVDGHVHHLESEAISAQRSTGMASWISSTKNHLADLEIQYAFQVEENKKTFNNFLSEIRKAYHLLDLKGSGLILLDNAINEYEQRMYLLLSSGEIIDREISKLITHIDQLQNQGGK